jgi:hypothetical protein
VTDESFAALARPAIGVNVPGAESDVVTTVLPGPMSLTAVIPNPPQVPFVHVVLLPFFGQQIGV